MNAIDPQALLDEGPIASSPSSVRRRWGFLKFVAKRLVLLPVSLFIVASICFAITSLLPGDPARLMAGEGANERQVEAIRAKLQLDRPVLEQYQSYMFDVAQGNLGRSVISGRQISETLATTVPASASLGLFSIAVAIILGVSLGMAMAYYQTALISVPGRVFAAAFLSVPEFFVGLILIYIFYAQLGWSPGPVGQLGLFRSPPPAITNIILVDALVAGDFVRFKQALAQLILPSLTLGLIGAATLARVTRSAMVRSLSSAQVELARARGLPERRVLWYAFTVARGPILTFIAVLLGAMLGGHTVIETIFGWNGVGQWGLHALLTHDIPAIQAFVLVSGAFVMIVYLLLDIVVVTLDPRISLTDDR